MILAVWRMIIQFLEKLIDSEMFEIFLHIAPYKPWWLGVHAREGFNFFKYLCPGTNESWGFICFCIWVFVSFQIASCKGCLGQLDWWGDAWDFKGNCWGVKSYMDRIQFSLPVWTRSFQREITFKSCCSMSRHLSRLVKSILIISNGDSGSTCGMWVNDC